MKLLISIRRKQIRLSLWKEGKEQDHRDILNERSLSEVILKEIDELLRKNKVIPPKIKEIKVESDQTDNFTTTRIAKTVANTWNWTREKMNS